MVSMFPGFLATHVLIELDYTGDTSICYRIYAFAITNARGALWCSVKQKPNNTMACKIVLRIMNKQMQLKIVSWILRDTLRNLRYKIHIICSIARRCSPGFGYFLDGGENSLLRYDSQRASFYFG